MQPQDYYQTARENETVFRNILRDLRDNRERRPMGIYIPNIKTELPLEEIFKEYSQGNRIGKFTINKFTREKDNATITFSNISVLSGGGAKLEYLVKEDEKVDYQKKLFTYMS